MNVDEMLERARERQLTRDQIERIERRAALARRQFDVDVNLMLKRPEGRRVLTYILYDLAGLAGRTFTGNSRGMYLQGRESVGKDLKDRLEQSSTETQALYLLMERERLEELAKALAKETDDVDD